MKVALLRVGIDSGSGGMQGPLFADGGFELIPIPDTAGWDPRTYGNTLGRYGRPLADYFPPARRARMAAQSMHWDPEFETYTYGDPTPPKAGLRRLEPGDLLVFYAGLEGWDHLAPPALYLIAYFVVQAAGLALAFDEEERAALFGANYHVRHRVIYEAQRERLVLVKGGDGSRLLTRAVLLSAPGQDRQGRPLKVLSEPMRQVFGDFGGHVSMQRSPTRWVDQRYVERAAEYLRAMS